VRAFQVTGTFAMGRKERQPFAKVVAADDETGAREEALSVFGSKHRTNRRRIQITAVVPVPEGEVDDPRVIAKLK
jgi:ribosomal protein L20A (L18A)